MSYAPSENHFIMPTPERQSAHLCYNLHMGRSKKTTTREITLSLKPGEHVSLTLHTTAPKSANPSPPRQRGFLAACERFLTPQALFFIGLALYLLTRLVALPSFPIYFGSDEATTVVRAADLIRDGFRDYQGQFLPTFF